MVGIIIGGGALMSIFFAFCAALGWVTCLMFDGCGHSWRDMVPLMLVGTATVVVLIVTGLAIYRLFYACRTACSTAANLHIQHINEASNDQQATGIQVREIGVGKGSNAPQTPPSATSDHTGIDSVTSWDSEASRVSVDPPGGPPARNPDDA